MELKGIHELVRKLVQEGKTREAIQSLLNFEKLPKNKKRQLILISSRLQKIEADDNIGIINRSEYQLELNKINNAILNLLDKSELTSTIQQSLASKIILFAVATGIIIFVIFSIDKNQKNSTSTSQDNNSSTTQEDYLQQATIKSTPINKEEPPSGQITGSEANHFDPSDFGELNEKVQEIIQKNVGEWLKFHGVNIDNFSFYEYENEEGFFPELYNLKEVKQEKRRAFDPVLYSFSPDQRYRIYCHFYDEFYPDEHGHIEVMGEPDSKVVLEDFVEEIAYSVRHCGSACDYQEAFFLNNRYFVLVGVQDGIYGHFGVNHPFLEIVDAKSGETWNYASRKVTKM